MSLHRGSGHTCVNIVLLPGPDDIPPSNVQCILQLHVNDRKHCTNRSSLAHTVVNFWLGSPSGLRRPAAHCGKLHLATLPVLDKIRKPRRPNNSEPRGFSTRKCRPDSNWIKATRAQWFASVSPSARSCSKALGSLINSAYMRPAAHSGAGWRNNYDQGFVGLQIFHEVVHGLLTREVDPGH